MIGKAIFYILAVIDLLGISFSVVNIIIDMSKGRDKGFNTPLGIGITLFVIILVIIGWYLKNKGHNYPAILLLAFPAVPIFLYAFFIGLFIVLKPDMK